MVGESLAQVVALGSADGGEIWVFYLGVSLGGWLEGRFRGV